MRCILFFLFSVCCLYSCIHKKNNEVIIPDNPFQTPQPKAEVLAPVVVSQTIVKESPKPKKLSKKKKSKKKKGAVFTAPLDKEERCPISNVYRNCGSHQHGS